MADGGWPGVANDIFIVAELPVVEAVLKAARTKGLKEMRGDNGTPGRTRVERERFKDVSDVP